MDPDDRSRNRRTTRPPIPREEDNREPVARAALRAQRPPTTSEHELVLQALKVTEGKMLAEINEQTEAREEFEARLRKELLEFVVREVKQSSAPPAKSRWAKAETSWIAHLPAILMAVAALVATLAQSFAKKSEVPAELLKRVDELSIKIDAMSQQLEKKTDSAELTAYKKSQYDFSIEQRAWLAGVLQRAASVKVDDPPGAPERERLQFYPSPIDHLKPAYAVRPRDPYPVPPSP